MADFTMLKRPKFHFFPSNDLWLWFKNDDLIILQANERKIFKSLAPFFMIIPPQVGIRYSESLTSIYMLGHFALLKQKSKEKKFMEKFISWFLYSKNHIDHLYLKIFNLFYKNSNVKKTGFANEDGQAWSKSSI